jgi:hypothetical protein
LLVVSCQLFAGHVNCIFWQLTTVNWQLFR